MIGFALPRGGSAQFWVWHRSGGPSDEGCSRSKRPGARAGEFSRDPVEIGLGPRELGRLMASVQRDADDSEAEGSRSAAVRRPGTCSSCALTARSVGVSWVDRWRIAVRCSREPLQRMPAPSVVSVLAESCAEQVPDAAGEGEAEPPQMTTRRTARRTFQPPKWTLRAPVSAKATITAARVTGTRRLAGGSRMASIGSSAPETNDSFEALAAWKGLGSRRVRCAVRHPHASRAPRAVSSVATVWAVAAILHISTAGVIRPVVRCKRRVDTARLGRFASRQSLFGDLSRDTQESFDAYVKSQLPNGPKFRRAQTPGPPIRAFAGGEQRSRRRPPVRPRSLR